MQKATDASPTNWGDLKKLDFPETERLLGYWLCREEIAMVFSWRGVGKTFFSLAVAQAVASGSVFLKWSAKAARVLYYDGEMGLKNLQRRMFQIECSAPKLADDGGVQFLTTEHMGPTPWNLALPQYQQAFEVVAQNADLVVLDNYSHCVRPVGRMSDKDAGTSFSTWLLDWKRKQRKAVLVVHHAGKNGTQRGFSNIEDPMDIVIQLKRPANHKIESGTRFELHFDKARYLWGKEIEPLMVDLIPTQDGLMRWHWTTLDDALSSEAVGSEQEDIRW